MEDDAPRSLVDHFEVGRVIGSGGFSTVRLGRSRENGGQVAIKTLKKSGQGGAEVNLIRNEIQVMALILEKVTHSNIVKLIDVFDEEQMVHLVMELCTGGELFDRIITRGRFSERDAANCIRQVAGALAALHSVNVLHRDLKPENMLFETVEEDARLKVMDFGLSHILGTEDVMQGLFGSLDYISPEALAHRHYVNTGDTWSLGVVLYILLSGYPPFHGHTNKEKQQKIMLCNFDFNDPAWALVSDSAKDLINHLLRLNFDERLTADEVLTHPWLAEGAAPDEPLPMETLDALEKFNARRKFRVVVYACIASSLRQTRSKLKKLMEGVRLTLPELESLRLAFLNHSSKDVGNDGVNKEKFMRVMESVDIHLPNPARVFELFDVNGDGNIDFRELVCGLNVMRDDHNDNSLLFCFKMFDTDNSGYISPEELGVLVGTMAGEDLAEDQHRAEHLASLFAYMDLNKDGKISWEEFRTAITNEPALAQMFAGGTRPRRSSLSFNPEGWDGVGEAGAGGAQGGAGGGAQGGGGAGGPAGGVGPPPSRGDTMEL